MTFDSNELREKAFEEFKKVAKNQKDDWVTPFNLRPLINQFSTAPKEENESWFMLFDNMAQRGDSDLMIQIGSELKDWARLNGYIYNR